jgi:uncharacterized SAM-binding protein YcdF (DUF218 family)
MRRRTLVIAVAVILVAAYFALPSILTAAARVLIEEDDPVRADVVMALAGDPRCAREREAARLYHEGLATTVIVSGAPVSHGLHTGEVSRRQVIAHGVPAAAVVVLRASWNTRTEAMELARVMRERGWRSAILVTSAFHSRRAAYTMRRAARDLTFHSVPVPPVAPEWRPERWWSRRGDAFLTVREWLSWGNTLVVGLS